MNKIITLLLLCCLTSCQLLMPIIHPETNNDVGILISNYRGKEVLNIAKIGRNDIIIFFTDGTELIVHSAKSITKNNSDGTKEKGNL